MEFISDSEYIIFSASHEASKKRVLFYIEDKLVFDLVIGLDYEQPDYEFPVDMRRFFGKKIKILCDSQMDIQFQKSNYPEQNYLGKYRPYIHFTARHGWINDPNGLIFYKGKYYMFFQHNPVATTWENMHWGLAVSDNLLHWKEIGDVIFPDENGTIFSGSGIVDVKNASGLQQGEESPLLFFYTSAGNTSITSKGKKFTQRLVVSVDGGKNFQKYPETIIEHIVGENRDPKVIYYEQDNSYILALFLDGHEFALFKSYNLLDWKEIQRIEMPEDAECPDFYPLPVEGQQEKKWIFSAASDRYYIGSFNGKHYEIESPLLQLNYGDISYAAQSWSDEPNDRRIRTAFLSRVISGQPFGSCMDVPQEMSLKYINNELMLCANPIAELAQLYGNTFSDSKININTQNAYLHKINSKACDIFLQISNQNDFQMELFGMCIKYQTDRKYISCNGKSAPIMGKDNILEIRLIFDTLSVEIFADEGSVFMGMAYVQDSMLNTLEIISDCTAIEKISINELEQVYK